MTPAHDADRFATLTFRRDLPVPAATLWQIWTAPTARAIWAAPTPEVTAEFVESGTSVGGREVSLCKVAGQPDIRCECIWLALDPGRRSVNTELISQDGTAQSAALVTAEISGDATASRLEVTVQLSSLATDMATGYRQGFGAGLDNLGAVAARTMVIERLMPVSRHAVWAAWMDPQALPQWWGPDGFSCRTHRIDLRAGGDWVFDMIGPDGKVFPNHHRYGAIQPEQRLAYTLLWGENGPKHADAWATFDEVGDKTRVTLGMVFSTAAEFQTAKGFGAVELGQQTLGKLERFAASR